MKKPMRFMQELSGGKEEKLVKPISFGENEKLIKPIIFEEKSAIKPFLIDYEYANANKKTEVQHKQILHNEATDCCNYEIIPIMKNVYYNREGIAINERECLECKLFIDGIAEDNFIILTSEITNLTNLIAKKYSYAIFNGTKKEAKMLESKFRKKTKMLSIRKIYVEHGWQLIGGKMLFLDDCKNGQFEFNINTGLSMPAKPLQICDINMIFQNALKIYEDITISSTLVLFSLLGVTFKLFESAGFKPRFVLFVNGKTGSMKTTLSKIFFTQLTDEKHRDTVRRIDSDTIVSFERALVKNGRDTVTLFDDYSPAKTAQKKSEMQNKLETIIRMVGDGSTKSRSNEKLQDIQGEGVHGAVVVTGELRGKGLSSNLRCLYCTLEKAKVNTHIVNWFQDNTEYFTSFISLFTEYLSAYWNNIITYIKNNFNMERERLKKEFKENRLLDSCVIMSILADILERFLVDYCNINANNINPVIKSMKQAVILNTKMSEQVSLEENPSTEFLKAVDILINKQEIKIGTKEEFIKINSFDGFMDDDYIYLLPSNIIAKVSQYYRSVNRYWNMEMSDVLGMLFEDKIIKSYSNGNKKRTYLARVVVGEGKKQGFIKISKEVYSAIIDDKYEA